MPNRVSLDTADVCSWATVRLVAPVILFVLAAAPAAAQVTALGGTVKVGFYNIQAGKGEPALPGRSTPFADTANCTDTTQPINAWGVGFVQQVLDDAIGSDPAVIALGLAEAWTSVCASPENVRQALGWKSRSASNNGLAIVARHGFSGSVTVLQLDTSQSTNLEPRYVTHAKVCVDAACGSTLDVFVTHMMATGSLRTTSMTTQVKQLLAFMAQQAGTRPRALLGDFNLYEEYEPTCGTASWSASILDNLRNAGYKDAWRTLKGSAVGYTGMTNRPGCGSPEGSTYKRIDYSWSLGLTPISVGLFGVVPAGDPAPSDHYGILAEYSMDGTTPPPDVAGPDVSLSAPAAGAEVTGVVTIGATASDPSGVSRVEFFADGSALGADSSAPYSLSWSTSALPNGSRVLQARAFDGLGNSSLSALRTVTVKNVTVPPPPSGTLDEVVVHASSASIAGTRWRLADDATAASGRLLFNEDLAAPRPSGASAAPADYAELRFTAERGKAYRLWVRGKAANNYWANDSMYVQFSDSVTASGTPQWRIGTTSSTIVQIEEGTSLKLSGWGWADNGYDAAGPLVYFETTGEHTVRLQIREDGLSIDQVVLSAVTYLTLAPGATKNDTTILAIPSTPPDRGIVTAYNAITDRVARPKPPLPVIGGAGFGFVDPAFGTRLLRVTDAQTRPVAAGRSFRTPSAAHQTAWNTTSTYFYVMNSGSNVVPFAFDAATMTASRIDPTGSGDGGLMLDFLGEPQFSYVSENLIYGVRKAERRTIYEYDFATNSYTPVLDLGTLGADLGDSYVGGILSTAGPVEKIMAFYGGMSQDRHFRVVVFEKNNPSRRRLLDTLASTVDGRPTRTLLNFKLHHVEIDRTGRYVLLSPTTADVQAPRLASVEYVWDLETDDITPLDQTADIAGGHKALGYGMMLNKGCCTSSTWDAAQWQLRSLATPKVTRDLISPVLLPTEIYMSDHASWNNAQQDRLVPFVSALYRYGNNTAPWRPWDDEIVAVRTEEGAGTMVWRFAHHRSNVAKDADPLQAYFNYMPRLNVSQDGRWAIFTSNWEKTLGIDAGSSSAEHRLDVFLVELPGASSPDDPPDPANQPPTVSLTAPATGAVVTAGDRVIVSASAADADGAVTRVDFFADGTAIGSAGAAPFSVSWQVPAPGSYTLSATAVDDDGASRTSATVAASAVARVEIVTVSLPAGGIGQTYAAVLEATGGTGSYTWDVTGGTLPPGIALAASGAVTGVPSTSGSFSFTARARDTADAGRSAARTFTLFVRGANQAPVVQITTPASGAVFAAKASITVTASASDPDGAIQRVDFYANSTRIGSRGAAPWTVTWTPGFGAAVQLRAVAVDNAGAARASAPVAVTVISDVIIHAGDATVVAGRYQFVSDATAAGGRRLWNPNGGADKVRVPLAEPPSYIEFTFHAEAGRPYHLWIRGKGEKNYWANDAAFVQYSGSVDAAGAPIHRIGTTSAAVYEVEEGLHAKLAEWGWEDTKYDGFAPHLYFDTTGPQRIRLQPREDGLSIDQIVISPLTWLETRPGATKNDTTIIGR